LNANVGEKQFTPMLTQIMNSGADGIIALAHQEESSLIMMQADAMGIDMPKIGAAGACSPIALTTAGKSSNGWYAVSDWTNEVTSDSGKAFVKAYREAYNRDADLQSAFAYDAMSIMGKAVELAGNTDHEAVNKALANVKDLHGASGVFTSDEKRIFGTSLFLVKIDNGIAKPIEVVSR